MRMSDSAPPPPPPPPRLSESGSYSLDMPTLTSLEATKSPGLAARYSEAGRSWKVGWMGSLSNRPGTRHHDNARTSQSVSDSFSQQVMRVGEVRGVMQDDEGGEDHGDHGVTPVGMVEGGC